MQINGIEIAGNPNQGSERIKIDLDHIGAKINYSITYDRFTAAAFIYYDMCAGNAVVIMVNGNLGPTITNAADQIIPFIHRQHLGRRGIPWKNVRFLYLDSEGHWDEIVVTSWAGAARAGIGFKALGDRTIEAMLAAARDSGFELDAHERAHLRNAINDAKSTVTLS